MIDVRELFREAWRNTMAVASRPLLALFLFAVTVGSLACLQAFTVVQVNRDGEHWRAVGASTQIVSLPGGVDGARCEALSSVAGIVASGAVREGPEVRLAALPSVSFESVEGTPGLSDVLDVSSPGGSAVAGVWVSSELAADIGADLRPGLALRTTTGDALEVAGVFNYPEDGRLPLLTYNFVSEVPAFGVFDSCWVEIWPEDRLKSELLTYSLISGPSNAADRVPEVRQLNSSEGTRFDGAGRLERMPAGLLLGASGGLGVFLGFALIRSRRLELASSLHAGVPKTSLCLQMVVEASIWLIPAASAAFAFAAALSVLDNPDSPWPPLIAASGVIAAGIFAVLLGTVAGTVLLSESHLFRYLKTR